MKTSIQNLVHIAIDRTSKTNTKQQKPNKPAISKPIRILPNHQASNQEACNCQRGRRQGRSLKIFSRKSPFLAK